MIEAGELWSFFGDKKEVCRVWEPIDAETRQVVVMVADDRSQVTAVDPREALPDEYRDGAAVRTDFPARYKAVVPDLRHVAAGEGVGLTNHLERLWLTLC